MKKLLLLIVSLLFTGITVFGQTTLLTEGWESTTAGSQVPPAGWAIDLLVGSNYIYFQSAGTFPTCSPYEGTKMLQFNSFNASSGTTNRIRRTASVSTVGYSQATVDFAWYLDSGYSTDLLEGVTVQWSTDGATWNNSTFFQRYNATPGWVIENVTLPAGAAGQATLYVAFSFYSQYGDNCYLDLVHVKGSSPCVAPAAQPTVLNLTAGMTNIMASFTASATATNYLVVRSLSSTLGATPANGTVYTVGNTLGSGVVDYWGTGTGYIATGLTANTRYYFYIFAANNSGCSGGPVYLTTSPLTGNILTLAALANLCGTKTIGATGSDYVNFTAAAFALSNSTLTCAVTLLINASYTSATETWPVIIPTVAVSIFTNKQTIKTNTGVTAAITGSFDGGTIFRVLNNNTIIDGSNVVSGTSQNLTITNNSATNPSGVMIGSTGTTPITNVTLKNTVIINGVGAPSKCIYISDGATQGTAGYFNNITIQNNNLQRSQDGIYSIAVSTPGNGSGLLITGNTLNALTPNNINRIGIYVQGVDGGTVSNNTIGNFATADASGNITGIWFASGTVNSTISGNTISGINGSVTAPRGIVLTPVNVPSNLTVTANTITNLTTASTGSTIGIYVGAGNAITNSTISNNMISNIKNTSAGGYLATAIWVWSATIPANVNVVNNAIWDIAGYGYGSLYYAYNGVGMLIYGGSGYNVYFNTVYMNTNQTVAGYPCSLFIYSSVTTAGAIDLRDNIFDNANTTATQAYAICSQTTNTVFSSIDYNDYWSAGANVGYANGVNCTNLAAIQTNFGGNVNSQNVNPNFVGSDLHPTNAALQNTGLFMAGWPTDLTGAGRSNPTDIGCYEWAPNQSVVTTAATNVTTANAKINGTITAANLTVTSGFDYGLTTAYGSSVAGTPASVTGNTATAITANLTGLIVNSTYHFRAKGTNGGLTVYGSDMTFSTAVPPVVATTAATVVGATFATLNGTVNPMDASTTLSFDWGLTVAYGNNIPGTPPTLTGNTVQNFSANLTGLVINTTYHYRAKAVNAVGTFYGTDQTFFTTCVVPPTPGAITGPAAVCLSTGGYTYSVPQVPYGFVYNWTFPAGFTITSYPYSNVVTVSVSGAAVAGTISVYASSNCGANSPSSTMAVAVNPLPVPTVTGASPVCQFTNNNYTTQSNMSGYTWTAGDGTITATGNPAVVTINWPTAGSKTVGVIYTNPTTGCTAASQGTLPVTVNAAPVPTITGTSNLCVNSGYYDYLTESGKTGYVWTVSSGGTITGGQGTFDVEIQWNTPGAQWVAVNYANVAGCSAPTATVFNVNVNGIPGTPGSISGPTPVCVGSQGIAYSVPPITNAVSYVWNLPAGVTIASGAGTNSITVNFANNAVTGDFTVYGNSICGNGPVSNPYTVTITQMPAAAGAVSGTDSVCGGSMGVAYSVAPVANATGYSWSLPAGATISSGNNTANITVDFAMGAVSGDISVYGTNSCGSGTVSPSFHVSVKPVPATPTITNHGDTLYSSVATGNQWFYNGAPVSTGTGQVFVAHYTGWYWDEIIKNGCVSDTSNHIYIVVTGVNDPKTTSFVVYPVPNDGQFKLQINSPKAESFDISISNSIGASIYSRQNVMVNGPTDVLIDLRPVAAGVYTMVIRNSESQVVRKIIVNR